MVAHFSCDNNTVTMKTALKSNFESTHQPTAHYIYKMCIRDRSLSSLQGGLLRVKDGHIEIIATNLNDFFYTKIKATVIEEGEGVCDIRHIVDFLNYLKPGDVTLSSTASTILIETDKTKGTFPVISATDYPALPTFEGETIDFTEKTLQDLPLVLLAASKDQARPVLTGVNFSYKQNVLYMSVSYTHLDVYKRQKL